jgi:hypothetical protein
LWKVDSCVALVASSHTLSISDFSGGIPASRQRFEQLVYMYISRQLC